MIKGIIIIAGIIILSVILNGVANWVESKPSPIERKFQVIDTYKGCDVVEYKPDYSARYSYFLHCTE